MSETPILAAIGAHARASGAPGRVGVVDIGSNTVRLVVYDRPERLPVPIFNEKSACALARGLDATGRLNPEGVEKAIQSLGRFTRLADAMGVERLDLVATAAVRDAADGPDFVARVAAVHGLAVSVLSGDEEARLAALGVVVGMPDADGLLADLGGGSLEVIRLNGGAFEASASLPVGHIRLDEAAAHDMRRARAIVERGLDGLDWLDATRGRTFYATGGSWRALARVFIDQIEYPLHVIDGFTLPGDEAGHLARVVSGLGAASLKRIRGFGPDRRRTLPIAALVMSVLVERMDAAAVMFSGFGMREGRLLEMLPAALRHQDPLIAGATGMAERTGRFPIDADEITAWMAPLFADTDGDDARRLRLAATLLSDIGWDEHPDYRAEHAFLRALRLPFAGLEHRERVIIALAIYVRNNGDPENTLVAPVIGMLNDADIERATVVGLALRLAHTISGSAPGLLRRAALVRRGDTLTLDVPADGEVFRSETVERRLKTLARAIGLDGQIG